jgi:hypothetical protein
VNDAGARRRYPFDRLRKALSEAKDLEEYAVAVTEKLATENEN